MEDSIKQAIVEGELQIGETNIPCAVLVDGTRLITRKGFLTALNRPWRGSSRTELPIFVGAKNIKPFVNKELINGLNPVKYKPLKGQITEGYNAEILPSICEVYLSAREAGVLTETQKPTARQAEILTRGLARVGIIALIDEATGYQKIRTKRALADILEKYIAKELRAWTKTFPDEFYTEMFRLKNWPHNPDTVKRPSVIGRYTNDIIYERLAPVVLEELRKKNPATPKGHRKYRHHQWLTGDMGHPKLKEHIISVMALMRASSTWGGFMRLLNRSLPKFGDTL